ncbi:MAG: RICIN domain-containing protein [Chitinophagaceae bacterium]|nr:RICIN domain-containing protein [Chitinophagaceae bacterium]
MKQFKFFIPVCISLVFCLQVKAQPAAEIGCMSNFDYDNSGNSKVNAYLLMLLNHFVYPHFTINKPEEDPAVTELHFNPQKFKEAYENKVGHYFFEATTISRISSPTIIGDNSTKSLSATKKAVFDFVSMSNGIGIDPEAMVISTDRYVIVVFRGTDRVANQVPLIGKTIYDWGEWIQTDAFATKVSPPSSFGFTRGKVHSGFNNAVLFNKPGEKSFLDSLVSVLTRRGVGNKRLWITGHSLGSATAILAASYMKKAKNINPFCIYAYASPHPGDADFTGQINTLFPNTTLQRFDFIDDPITLLPGYFLGFQRAGARNRYSKESGSSNYFFNSSENAGDKVNAFFCLHHTNWYARAAFFELIDHHPEMASKLPAAPPKPTSFCSFIDDQIVGGTESFGAALVGGHEDIEEGTYYLMNGKSLKFLEVPGSVTDQNGSRVELGNLPSGKTNAQWKVRKVVNGVVGGYTIQLVKDSKYLDADLQNVNNNGCKVQLWERSFLPDKRNQEWYIQRLNSGRFRVKNVMNSNKLLHISSSSADNNGADITLNESLSQKNQEWFFVKIQ